MKKFQYQTLRFMPDRLSGEFINLGVVVLDAEAQRLFFRFYTRTGRLHDFFPGVNSRFVVQTVKGIAADFAMLQSRLEIPILFKEARELEGITSSVIPKDDSALFFTEVTTMLDLDGTPLLSRLYDRLIIQHIADEDRTSLQDAEVWHKIYKHYFDNASFAKDLREEVVKTEYDEIHFHKTCRNGVLHCFEPVSFQLQHSRNIKSKAYTWAGRFQELETSEEAIHIYLLAAMPADPKLKKMLRDKFANTKIGAATIELVDESHAEQVVRNVEKLMGEHG